MARAGYDMRIATVDSRCGGCGADISQGAEYGYDPIAMQICEGCIQVFEEEDRAKKRTFAFHAIELADLSAIDLREEASAYNQSHMQCCHALHAAKAYRITIYDDKGMNPEAETAEALFCPYEDRLGIAWTADATWASIDSVECIHCDGPSNTESVEAGIEMWLNESERWEARN
jgi:hypothetical protein